MAFEKLENNKYDLVCLVSNDLSHDDRMRRTCQTLVSEGLRVLLVGRQLHSSIELKEEHYCQYRVKCWFNSGPLFYLELVVRFAILLRGLEFYKLLCVDFDTIFVTKLIYKKNSIFYVDLHELFTEVPELQGANIKKSIWNFIGTSSIKRFDFKYTVNESLKEYFSTKYNTAFKSVRNIPDVSDQSRRIFNTPFQTVYIGMFNPGRGLENLVDVIKSLQNVNLLLIGSGPLEFDLKERAKGFSNVEFTGMLDAESITDKVKGAHVGWNILDGQSLSYYLSLANKYFDYTLRGIPCISMDFPEYKKLQLEYNCAYLIEQADRKSIKAIINTIMTHAGEWQEKHNSCLAAAQDLNWENEKLKLKEIFLSTRQRDCYNPMNE